MQQALEWEGDGPLLLHRLLHNVTFSDNNAEESGGGMFLAASLVLPSLPILSGPNATQPIPLPLPLLVAADVEFRGNSAAVDGAAAAVSVQ